MIARLYAFVLALGCDFDETGLKHTGDAPAIVYMFSCCRRARKSAPR